MTNQAQAIREFIEAGKKRTQGPDLPMPADETAWDKAFHVAASRLDLSDLLDVVREMAEALKKQQKQLRILIPQAGIVNDERMALMAGDQALTRARPYLGGE